MSNTKHDDKVKLFIDKVEKQKAELGAKPKTSWVTNGIFKYKDGQYFNLNTVRDPQPLVDALSFLLEKSENQYKASARLGVDAKEYTWDGYTVTEWEKDFKARLAVLLWEDKKAETEMELAKIEKLLGL